ncbi:hypothetical protein MBM_03525 [Drepanopeziza brunnea f. sp. 'multigermtubi' MB_m1]|uniref:threonine--tRNA ligase n=1 Tax=Marssonina brunnea f. sp. multigermtubi (strain MB_m1) TaxID=1072389 RepID=K1X0M6_MARBU|nr:uncharacterized protein MBM_03525 [Drepanopeziza brunnea f. sp. 'multigermtubi' MB_m1]EKD18532.1 hypothetical protein MBM_03525 [Drepanopeziza brunnea f. sp. 'multigermtubi' MB_m1]
MRSSRALRLLPISARNPHAASQTRRKLQQSIRNGYCTVCEPPAPVTERTAESTTNTPKSLADHRQLGIEQELFTTSIYSPGSPMFLPNGTRIFNRLTNFVRSKYDLFGFQEVITPTIYKRSLWEKSGHWDHYADDMYAVTGRGAKGGTENKQVGEDEEYGLKPMNCPGHCLIFASKQRSYRDLPIRYADFSPLHRNEIHGALSGLTRVRRFHQDDGHIFCRPSQIEEEISSTLGFIKLAYKALKLGPYRLALSTRPADHFIGTIEEWENAEAALIKSLDASGQEWTLNKGDGAFYGPKIDVILKDSDGKEHQTATVQLDFQLPKRFELEYQAPAAEFEQKGLTTEDPELLAVQGPVTPVLIHRAVLGSVERIMALLIEHHNGHWPFWLNPRQVMIITVNDSLPVVEFAHKCRNALTNTLDEDGTREDTLNMGAAFGLSVDIDSSARSIGKKIREAKQKRYSVIAVIGEKDISEKSLVVDLTGIPGAEGGLPQNRLLAILAAEKKGILDHEAISQVSQVPALNPGDLKNLRMPLSALKTVLNSIQTQYL